MTALLAFIKRLTAAGLDYRLSNARSDAVMVEVAVPGERWEVEFFEDGHVESERFVSDGTILDAGAIERLLDFGESDRASRRS